MARRSGFSLIELTVVIGVILILIGLLLPSLSTVMSRGRLTRMTAVMHSNAVALDLYIRDSDDFYPLANPKLFVAARMWYEPLVTLGILNRARDADPPGWRDLKEIRIELSMCMLQRAEQMQPGKTVPPDEAMSVGVRLRQVLFPASKGVLGQRYEIPGVAKGYWCCVDGLDPKPVAMADGAVLQGRWQDFTLEDEVYIENGIGEPVFSTWGGYEARDR